MIANDFNGLSKNLSSLSNRIVANTDKRKRVTALAIDQNVVQETPVDEGRARSNWQVSASTPVTSTVDAYAPGTKGSTAAANTQAAIDQGQAVLSKEVLGQPVFIVNNLPYIRPLNEGHSAQVNPGFIERSINRGIESGRKVSIVADKQ